MVAEIFNVISSVITNFTACLTSAFTSITAVVWDGTALTAIGTLLVIAFGIGVVYFALRYILQLIQLKRG